MMVGINCDGMTYTYGDNNPVTCNTGLHFEEEVS